jgi:hypothetical protein
VRAAALVVAIGCGSRAPAPATSNRAERHESARPAPTITVEVDGSFTTTHLPALASDGSLVVAALQDPDRPRGNSNMMLEVRGRDGTLAKKIELLSVSEYEHLVTGDGVAPVLVRRVKDANSELSNLHAAHDLVEMMSLTITDADHEYPSRAEGAGLVVTWDGNLHVADTTGHELASAHGETWQAARVEPCARCETCVHPVILSGAYRAPRSNLVLVEIGYSGTDACRAPRSQLHVVVW